MIFRGSRYIQEYNANRNNGNKIIQEFLSKNSKTINCESIPIH